MKCAEGDRVEVEYRNADGQPKTATGKITEVFADSVNVHFDDGPLNNVKIRQIKGSGPDAK